MPTVVPKNQIMRLITNPPGTVWFGLFCDGYLISIIHWSEHCKFDPDVFSFGVGFSSNHEYEIREVRVTV